jgi:DNA transformation protein
MPAHAARWCSPNAFATESGAVGHILSKTTTRPSVLAPGSFGAFVVDQLSALGAIDAKPMFGGAGFYLDGEFFGILYKERLYFRVSADTITHYTSRKMRPFEPFEGRKGQSRRYYEVPIEIVESADDLVKWAKAAHRAAPVIARPTTTRPSAKRPRPRSGDSVAPAKRR